MKITDLIWNNAVTRFIGKHWIAIVVLLTIPSYLYGREVMISQISEYGKMESVVNLGDSGRNSILIIKTGRI
jgi:hypothetical protein